MHISITIHDVLDLIDYNNVGGGEEFYQRNGNFRVPQAVHVSGLFYYLELHSNTAT